MDGIEFAARFSYITNFLRFCGPEEASTQFLEYIKNKKNSEEIKESLKRFEGLYPYLSAIAEKHNKNFYDYDVVEAYWIGNKLLDSFEDDDLKIIIKKLMQRGLPKSIGTKLIKNLPSGFAPHHNFNVFYVGVGRTTGSVETTLQNMDNCRTSWGYVIEVQCNSLIVKTQSLKKIKNKFYLDEEQTKTAVYLKEMLPEIKNGDVVVLHWGFAPIILEEKQVENLKKYTNLVLDVMNNINSQKNFIF